MSIIISILNMENINACHHKSKVIFILGIVLVAFFISLTLSTMVGIDNKVKEGKYIGQDVEIKNSITISGTGEIYSKPDLAVIVFSVRNEAKTVSLAMTENTEKMNSIISTMKSKGVEDKDLKTTNFSVQPRYEWQRAQIEVWPQPDKKRVLIGYEINQSLQVKIRDLNKIGEIIQRATDAGASQVGNLQFTIDDYDELKNQAREEAIKEAKEKAEELADQLGVKLVRIIGFSEGGSVSRYYDYGMQEMSVSMDQAMPEIATGENKIAVSVSITYEIN